MSLSQLCFSFSFFDSHNILKLMDKGQPEGNDRRKKEIVTHVSRRRNMPRKSALKILTLYWLDMNSNKKIKKRCLISFQPQEDINFAFLSK